MNKWNWFVNYITIAVKVSRNSFINLKVNAFTLPFRHLLPWNQSKEFSETVLSTNPFSRTANWILTLPPFHYFASSEFIPDFFPLKEWNNTL